MSNTSNQAQSPDAGVYSPLHPHNPPEFSPSDPLRAGDILSFALLGARQREVWVVESVCSPAREGRQTVPSRRLPEEAPQLPQSLANPTPFTITTGGTPGPVDFWETPNQGLYRVSPAQLAAVRPDLLAVKVGDWVVPTKLPTANWPKQVTKAWLVFDGAKDGHVKTHLSVTGGNLYWDSTTTDRNFRSATAEEVKYAQEREDVAAGRYNGPFEVTPLFAADADYRLVLHVGDVCRHPDHGLVIVDKVMTEDGESVYQFRRLGDPNLLRGGQTFWGHKGIFQLVYRAPLAVGDRLRLRGCWGALRESDIVEVVSGPVTSMTSYYGYTTFKRVLWAPEFSPGVARTPLGEKERAQVEFPEMFLCLDDLRRTGSEADVTYDLGNTSNHTVQPQKAPPQKAPPQKAPTPKFKVGDRVRLTLSDGKDSSTEVGGGIEAVTPFVLTHSGQKVKVIGTAPETIFIWDIATALSRRARWNGHSTRVISVAEHSVYVAKVAEFLVKRDSGGMLSDRYWGAHLCLMRALLHDAAEAYVGDVPMPVKRVLTDWDEKIERPLQELIYARFHCGLAARQYPGARIERCAVGERGWDGYVKKADKIVNQLELESLMGEYWMQGVQDRHAMSTLPNDDTDLIAVRHANVLRHGWAGNEHCPAFWAAEFKKAFYRLNGKLMRSLELNGSKTVGKS